MPTAPPIERFQPSFYRFPIQNNRTGFQPVFLPIILIISGRRTPDGFPLANTGVSDLRYFVTDAPEPSLVAGPFNTGLLIPQLSKFIIPVSDLQLSEVQISLQGRTFIDAQGNNKSFDEAVEGDKFEYTLIRGKTTSTIPFFPDADYYDLSVFLIDVDDLPRPKRYLFVWECKYFRRHVFSDVEAGAKGPFCIKTDDIAIAQFPILINHPGEVHNEMFQRTPPFYFDADTPTLAEDPILRFYRPYADILQDIFDEQSFIDGINHINKIPAQLIPYLAYLIGWDLPNFPGVSDTLRRSILRQAVELQKLKGSRRAIVELFDIFGFAIELLNLWYATDGSRFVAPNETLPDTLSGNKITTKEVCQIEPMVADYKTAGFGKFEIPLLYRAVGDITINAWLVKNGPTRDALNQAIGEMTFFPDALINQCARTADGFFIPLALLDRVPISDPTVIATSEVLIGFETGQGKQSASTSTIPLINQIGCRYDQQKNIVGVTFDHYLDFSDDTQIFLFATYPRTEIVIPIRMKNLRSNRFDVRILLKDGEIPSSQLLEFLLNFLFRLKAFHSLLRKITFELPILDVYNVQDYCNPETFPLMTPPAILPVGLSGQDECTSIDKRGIKEYDVHLRELIFRALLAEQDAWKSLDGTHDDPDSDLLNLPVTKPEGTSCQFTQVGQDRVLATPDADFDHEPDLRSKLCDSQTVNPPNCFKGRVIAELVMLSDVPLCEMVRCIPCPIGMGAGTYYLLPTDTIIVQQNGFGKFIGQNEISFLGVQMRRYNHPIPQALYFTDRPYLTEDGLRNDRLLAYRKPSLDIQKESMGFPGHRYVSMSHLKSDFIHPIWKAKPWDPDVGNLHAHLAKDTAGDEVLVYDDADLIYLGNGIDPDISSLGHHDPRSFLVTHKVFMFTQPGHPCLTLDPRIVETIDEDISFDSSLPFGPLFKSYNAQCNKDFRSGYPAVYNEFEVDISQFDFDRGDSASAALAELLGLPVRGASGSDVSNPLSALFTLGSMILLEKLDPNFRYFEPFRLDCDCLIFECAGSGSSGQSAGSTGSSRPILNVNTCPTNVFRLPDGSFESNCDKLEIEPTVILAEKLGVCSTRLDGTIPNMLCILDNGEAPSKILSEGSIKYKDSYDVIYEASWTFKNGILNLIMVTKSPVVWGQPPSGFLRGRLVFRRGIITTIKQILRINDDNSYEILLDKRDQVIDFYQSNAVCGERQFKDEFCYHLDCFVTDEVLGLVVCGTRWVDLSDLQVVWPDLVVNSSGIVVGYSVDPGKQPFIFMDVWGNDDDAAVTMVCPSGSA